MARLKCKVFSCTLDGNYVILGQLVGMEPTRYFLDNGHIQGDFEFMH